MLIAMMIAASLGMGDPDGVVATAPSTTVDLDAAFRPAPPSVAGAAQAAAPHGLSTDEQIARWLASRAPSEGQSFPEGQIAVDDDRKVHGEVNVSVGTGGYRDYGAAVSMPLGASGRLDLRVRQTENDYASGRYGRYWMEDGADWSHGSYPAWGPVRPAHAAGRLARTDIAED